MKLSDLQPGDVAVFVHADGGESEPFVTLSDRDNKGRCGIETPRYCGMKDGDSPVRRLGRGRLVPARIAMDDEPNARLTWTDAKPTAPGWY